MLDQLTYRQARKLLRKRGSWIPGRGPPPTGEPFRDAYAYLRAVESSHGRSSTSPEVTAYKTEWFPKTDTTVYNNPEALFNRPRVWWLAQADAAAAEEQAFWDWCGVGEH